MNFNLLPVRWQKSLRKRNVIKSLDGFDRLEERTMLSAVIAPIDGVGNNISNPDWGTAETDLLRLATAEYADGISEPAGADRPSAREVSNAIVDQEGAILNSQGLSDLAWIWGQFLDHDIDLTESAHPEEEFDIEVPTGDPEFDPFGSGTAVIDLNRSIYNPETGDSVDNVRQQVNQITAFIDGSVVYGSDEERAAALRTFSGGELKTSAGELLPFNEEGLANAGGTSSDLFLAGDVRANENAALSAMHTVWVREHNRLANDIAQENPSLSDEEIYQAARRIVTAEIQFITYNEYLPALLGEGAIDLNQGYDETVNPGVSNLFSTAAYRLGHSLLSTELMRLNPDGSEATEGGLSLSEAFFAPEELIDHGIDSLLQGAATNTAQELDNQIVDDVRNFLFGPPGAGGFDLASLNIQRGRDHGLPDYNQVRVDLGLEPVNSFAEITSELELQQKLEEVYGDVNNIDVWVGGLAEDHLENSNLGELFQTVLIDQFTRLRDGDRFWYQNQFSGDELREIESTTLSDVIMRNTEATRLQENVFYDPSVMYYEVQEQKRSARISVRVDETYITIRDKRSGEVLQQELVGDITKVKLVGADLEKDQFEVDLRRAADVGPLLIEVYGGEGAKDKLVIRRSAGTSATQVSGSEIQVNQVQVKYTEVEKVSERQTRKRRKAEPPSALPGFVGLQSPVESSTQQQKSVDSSHSNEVGPGNAQSEELFELLPPLEQVSAPQLIDGVFESIGDDLLG